MRLAAAVTSTPISHATLSRPARGVPVPPSSPTCRTVAWSRATATTDAGIQRRRAGPEGGGARAPPIRAGPARGAP
ncbi:hypothetical protein, partial [Streptomyces sp. NPDC058964]|uniref:hypothetical protein n=1 Tax=Streptomyces sp. NPDC058964 TaxID=3346681 RepID=UPI0036BA2B1D